MNENKLTTGGTNERKRRQEDGNTEQKTWKDMKNIEVTRTNGGKKGRMDDGIKQKGRDEEKKGDRMRKGWKEGVVLDLCRKTNHQNM